jgi:hypothetical protein
MTPFKRDGMTEPTAGLADAADGEFARSLAPHIPPIAVSLPSDLGKGTSAWRSDVLT